MWLFLDQRQSKSTAAVRGVTIKVTPGFGDPESRNLLSLAIEADEPFKDLLFKLFAPDAKAEGDSKTNVTFEQASRRIYVVDNWAEGSAAGTDQGAEPVAEVRVRADATVKDLLKETGVDLGASSRTSSPTAKGVDASLLERAAGGSPTKCLVFAPVGNGRLSLVTLEEFGFPLVLSLNIAVPRRLLGRLYRHSGSYLDTQIYSARSGNGVPLEDARKLSAGLLPGDRGVGEGYRFTGSSPLSIPLSPELDVGGALGVVNIERLIVGGRSQLLGSPVQPEVYERNALVPTITPTDQRDVLRFEYSLADYRLVCIQ
jgi:hypothetical protein